MSYLPGILAEIAEVAGEPAAIALADRVGGTEVWIPRHVDADHWLVQAVGREAADAICSHFIVHDASGQEIGLRRVLIPQGPAGVMARARRRLREALQDGTSVRQAAQVAGLHERTGWRMKRRLGERRNDDQGDLF